MVKKIVSKKLKPKPKPKQLKKGIHDYGYSSYLPATDERQPYFKEQRTKRGFDDTETWSLYSSIASFVLPRLKRYKECNIGFPGNLTFDQFQNKIQQMIDGFEELINEDDSTKKTDWDKIGVGLDLFREYYFDLWC